MAPDKVLYDNTSYRGSHVSTFPPQQSLHRRLPI